MIPPRTRHDGWTPARCDRFAIAIAGGASVTAAAVAAGMSRESAYRLRAREPDGSFARLWTAASATCDAVRREAYAATYRPSLIEQLMQGSAPLAEQRRLNRLMISRLSHQERFR